MIKSKRRQRNEKETRKRTEWVRVESNTDRRKSREDSEVKRVEEDCAMRKRKGTWTDKEQREWDEDDKVRRWARKAAEKGKPRKRRERGRKTPTTGWEGSEENSGKENAPFVLVLVPGRWPPPRVEEYQHRCNITVLLPYSLVILYQLLHEKEHTELMPLINTQS
jgi:hypothetical protein